MALKSLAITVTGAARQVLPIAAKPAEPVDEYTPEQRRTILAGIKAGRKGPYHGPFRSGAELEAYLKNIKSGFL